MCMHVYGCGNGMDGYVQLIDDPDFDEDDLEGGNDIEWFDFCPNCGAKLLQITE